MHCPYCTSDINDVALVCPVCTRDLYLFKPLLQRIAEVEKQIRASNDGRTLELESRVAALESAFARLRGGLPEGTTFGSWSASAAIAAARRNSLASALIAYAMLVTSLLLAHALIVVVYDLNPVLLRIASLLIPLPFGFALYIRNPGRGSALTIIAAAAACGAVIGMSAVTALVDNISVLPRDLRELREFIEYAASISFSFLTGVLLGKILYHRVHGAPAPSRMVVLIARLFAPEGSGELGLQEAITRFFRIVAAVAPVASAVLSIYTGIRAVIGYS